MNFNKNDIYSIVKYSRGRLTINDALNYFNKVLEILDDNNRKKFYSCISKINDNVENFVEWSKETRLTYFDSLKESEREDEDYQKRKSEKLAESISKFCLTETNVGNLKSLYLLTSMLLINNTKISKLEEFMDEYLSEDSIENWKDWKMGKNYIIGVEEMEDNWEWIKEECDNADKVLGSGKLWNEFLDEWNNLEIDKKTVCFEIVPWADRENKKIIGWDFRNLVMKFIDSDIYKIVDKNSEITLENRLNNEREKRNKLSGSRKLVLGK